ncbi:LURP-one-related/scramblase family protein [Alishewanella sp. d11]|uniref:LURP-one-related/scramblase family protein n=1 Tax=Alishewanella sp. d11 TaxID=3414030 RepID=UPI003BF81B2E
MKYLIKQKLLSLTDSFTIEDERGRAAYLVKGKIFSFSSSQTLSNAAGLPLLKIRRKYLSIMPACRIVNNDGSEWLVRKRFWAFLSSRFLVKTPFGQLEMKGNFWQHEYDIRQQGQLIASVSKKWFSWSDTYAVDIFKPEWTEQLLALMIVIDRLQHSDRNSTFGD